jgi:RNA polymerase sigma factor (TIGR02999 family)
MAASRMRREPPGHTLQPTALVHEVYLRLFGSGNGGFQNRAHFFAAAGEAMRRILVERARRQRQLKRGGALRRVGLEYLTDVTARRSADPCDVLAVHDALTKLETFDARSARIVELRCFVGMQIDEVAAALALSPRTVDRDWQLAKAWLRRELAERATTPTAEPNALAAS